MKTKVFLSLSYVDEAFVEAVYQKLPRGYALFYKESFVNGRLLIGEMEKNVSDAAIFVLFASKSSANSPWVNFELDQARIQAIVNPNHRILIFPTNADVQLIDLPHWLRQYWIERAGWTPPDIVRYITNVLLEPNSDFSAGAVQVIGRGQTADQLLRIEADHIARTGVNPNVYFLSGIRGVGRRTFASYYMRVSLNGESNLIHGPVISLSHSADIADVHSAVRNEISSTMSMEQAVRERTEFNLMPISDQIEEIIRLLNHYSNLGQAVTFISAGGFFEDRGEPKQWLVPLIKAISSNLTIFMISNRKIDLRISEQCQNLVQLRVDELNDKDIRAIMVFAARRAGIEKLEISDEIVRAIGGHADVAKAAVRLVESKGAHVLQRDPSQLYNFQNVILGESVAPESLSNTQKKILSLLSWVPKLTGSLLEQVLLRDGVAIGDQVEALEDLIMGCLVIPSGSDLLISPAIRMIYRRFNVTPADLLKNFSYVLSAEWKKAAQNGEFRSDLFEAFVFMNALEGTALPVELRPLLTPGMLEDVLRETYARGKDDNDESLLKEVIQWGAIADQIRMSDATREEILGTVARSHIRLGEFSNADKVIGVMQSNRYRSVNFLRGHNLRRQGKYGPAIVELVEAVRDGKNQRSAIHELALAYKKSGKFAELKILLQDHRHLITDSATFADFQIGIDLARNDLNAAQSGIVGLRRLPDDDGRSDIRDAQLSMKQGRYREAYIELSSLLDGGTKNKLRIRCLRATCGARSGQEANAQRDIEYVRRFPVWKSAAIRLEADLLIEKGQPVEARHILDGLSDKSPEDWLLYARALDKEAEMPNTLLSASKSLQSRASELRLTYNFALEYDFGD